MKQINLLPKHVYETRRRRQLIRRSVMTGLACVLVGVVWAGVTVFQTSRLDRQWRDVQGQMRMVQESRKQRNALRSGKKKLQAELDRYERLKLPLPPSSVVCLVSQLMSDSLALDQIKLTADPPVLQTADQMRNKAKKSAPPPRKPMGMWLSGAATSDIAVAGFVRQLAEHPLFDAVKLVSSRQVDDGDRSLQKFAITAQIPLERRFLFAEAQGGDDVE